MFNWDYIFKGVQLLLGVQLLVVAFIHFIKSRGSKIYLAILCLLLGLWFFKRVFSGYWNDNLFLFILIGPGKPIYAGSLLLFYYKSLQSEVSNKFIAKHLAIPTFYYLAIIVFRFFLIERLAEINLQLSVIFSSCVFGIYLYYFFRTKKELYQSVKTKLISKAFKKVLFLFYSIYFFLLQVPIWDLYKNLLQAKILPEGLQTIGENLFTYFFKYIGIYASYGYVHLLGYLLFLYALSEVIYFKKLFLPKRTLINQNLINNKAKLENLVHDYFYVNKEFTKSDLSLEICAKQLDVKKQDLFDHIKSTRNVGFKEFVNRLRVEEFKTLLENRQYDKYDLIGLAKECGFTSKSTFYRVFKEIEGITPNEFKKINYNRQ